MPLTFAHPAAVLPFSRKSKYINFLALVLGSMAPDFEYFLRGMPYGVIGHTFFGFVFFNLPVIIIVYWTYKKCIHSALYQHLPSILQDCPSDVTKSAGVFKSFVFLYCAFLGMLTHVVWDAFTHLEGYMVRNLSILSYPVQILNYQIPLFKLLQHGSTITGITFILGYLYIRAGRSRNNRQVTASPNQKLIYWGLIALFTIIFFGLWYLIGEVSIQAYGIIVVRIIDAALIGLLIVSLYFKQMNRVKE
ncbi:DUF4184 family protein [Ureibacillus sinduriensis]|uniref:DUF4184 family protein n=1 Tax=Ureibacillus sinduriensis BLB-1 = JCM 15800 TaxID=1384057 RepID=A0A0A3HUR1_9BACL|nr:DUF4184 family protein [Ureibacillus sinduriensis]KGR76301.1 hypothetical protein CD33_07085 [Ureibacillus sinduriensis BLB-1 = JCM 15800]